MRKSTIKLPLPENVLLLTGWTVESYVEQNDELHFTATPPPLPSLPLCETKENKKKGISGTCRDFNTSKSMQRYDKRTRKARDIPVHGKPVTIEINEHRYRCNQCRKFNNTKHSDLSPRYRMTERCVTYIQREAFRRPFDWVARDIGVDEKTIRSISSVYADARQVTNSSAPWKTRYLGVDDVRFNKITRTIFVDLETRRPVDILAGYEMADLARFFSVDREKKQEMIKVVCIDMASHFTIAIKDELPNALIIFDKWHVQKQALDAMDTARIYLQKSLLKAARKNRDRITSARIDGSKLQEHRDLFKRRRFYEFKNGTDVVLRRHLAEHPCLAVAYNLKEQFCDIWVAKSIFEATTLMENWIAAYNQECENYEKRRKAAAAAAKRSRSRLFIFPEIHPAELFSKVKRSIDEKGRQYVLNYFATEVRFTNAATEAANGVIKVNYRLGRGYSFAQIKARSLYKEPERVRVRKSTPNRRNRAVDSSLIIGKEEVRPALTTVLVNGRPTVKCEAVGCREMMPIDMLVARGDGVIQSLVVDAWLCHGCRRAQGTVADNQKMSMNRHRREDSIRRSAGRLFPV